MKEQYYFAPLFSPKQKHKQYKNNISFFKIVNEKTKSNLGIIRFSDMIPVPQESVSLLDSDTKSYGYRRLLSEQYSCINKPENRKKILEKAEWHNFIGTWVVILKYWKKNVYITKTKKY